MITVLGAGGNTGGRVASMLLDRGCAVRVVGRSPAKLSALAQRGGQVMIGDLTDRRFLTAAFEGANAAYVLLAPDVSAVDYSAAQDEMGEAICAALAVSGVHHAVALSSLGADKAGATGVLQGLRRQEARLTRIAGLGLTVLRPASFFENVLPQIEHARATGVFADVYTPDLKIPMVAARDIAAAAAKILAQPTSETRSTQELLGPEDVCYDEVALALGHALGVSLRYVRTPDEAMLDILMGTGASRSFALGYLEMVRAINDQALAPQGGRNAENTTQTSFARFLEMTIES
jgi:uncharacterized protein YbjT (DUF2867 family)